MKFYHINSSNIANKGTHRDLGIIFSTNFLWRPRYEFIIGKAYDCVYCKAITTITITIRYTCLLDTVITILNFLATLAIDFDDVCYTHIFTPVMIVLIYNRI